MIAFFWVICLLMCILGIYAETVRFTLAGKHLGSEEKNPILHIVEWICLVLTLLVISSNIYGVDIINYNNWYIRSETIVGREGLYTFLRNSFKITTGASFYVFRAAMTAVFGLFPIVFFRKNNINICFVLFVYNISFVFFDSMQFRNCIALFVLIFMTGVLIKSKNKFWAKVVFAIGILIISQIHTMFIVYLLFIPMLSEKRKRYGKIIFLCSLILMLITVLNGNRIPLLNIAYSLFLSSADNRLYSNAGGHFIFLLPTFIHILTTTFLLYFYKKRQWNSDYKSQFYKKYVDFVIAIDLCFFFVVSLIIVNTTFYRVIRNLFPLNIIAVYFLYKKEESPKKKLLMIFMLIAISFGWLIFKTKFYSSFEIIVDPVLKNGDLFYLH